LPGLKNLRGSCIYVFYSKTIETKNCMKHSRVYILGSGCFGSRAFNFLQPRFQPASLTVVDKRYHQLKKIITQGGNAVVMDAILFLQSSKDKMDMDDWVVPAVPIHVVYEWLRQDLRTETVFKSIPVPKELEALLPNPIRGVDGQLYASNADFLCPDDCDEPDQYCTVTGKPRPQILCDTLSGLKLSGYHSKCIVSSQLAPGVGGFKFQALLQTKQELKAHPGKWLVSTSCKCHSVIHAFSLSE
jgi:hypothetical protein